MHIERHYDTEQLGCISMGPSHKIVTSVTMYRNSKNQLMRMIDIRMNSYSSKDNKYYPSRKGITVPQKIVLPLYNAILELLPMAEVELDKPTVTVDTWERKPGYDVRLNIVSWEGKMYIDIREYISKPTSDGYTGYTPKGIRIPYDCKDMFVAQLYGGYEKLLKLDEEFGPMAEFGKGKMAVADPKMVREG